MKFYDYRDTWTFFKKLHLDKKLSINSREELYRYILSRTTNDPISFRHLTFDKRWIEDKRPYYDVYPSIIPMLIKLNLKVAGNIIFPPMGMHNLLIRFPENHILCSGDVKVRTIFLSFQKCNRDTKQINLENGLVVGIDIGEEYLSIPIFTLRIFPLDERPIEDTLTALRVHDSFKTGVQVPNDLVNKSIKLCLTLCLLENNSELIKPEILTKDQYKSGDFNRLVAKARRRGKFGFSIGKEIEKIPHYRRPHPALVWTGKGRKIPKIVMRKGSIIHREAIKKIPTGFYI